MVINIEILLTTALVWPASSNKWKSAQKAPQVSRQMEVEARLLSMIQNGGARFLVCLQVLHPCLQENFT